MDLIMAKSMQLDLEDDLKTKYDAKIGHVYAEYQETVESLITALQKEDQELNLTSMKTAVS